MVGQFNCTVPLSGEDEMGSTVTLDKTYFETLLRRAEFHTSGKDLTTPLDLESVSIPKVDHDYLLQMAREYVNVVEKYNADVDVATLQLSLRKGGITEETLELLIHDESNQVSGAELSQTHCLDGTMAMLTRAPVDRPKSSGMLRQGVTQGHWPSPFESMADQSSLSGARTRPGLHQHNSSFNDGTEATSRGLDSRALRSDRSFFSRTEDRTILFKGLPDMITYQDIVECIRGGMILDVFMRPGERVASVSFVEGSSARQFLNYTRKHDIYIGAKRIEIQWSDRHFTLPGHIANKIGHGATRNLVIRGVLPSITGAQIRDDLEHIHNLVIVKLSFSEGNAYIELNSVHNSVFAKTCMISRARYKGMRIEWYPDECAQPISAIPVVSTKSHNPPVSAEKVASISNRFQSLAVDQTEDGSSEGGMPQSDVVSEVSGLNVNLRGAWRSQRITA